MQQTFTDIEYSRRKKKTRREEFLDTMDQMIPWADWVAMIQPYYPSGKRGHPPRGIETMLRMYMMQNWFNLSDAAMEDAVNDSYAMRSFLHIDEAHNLIRDDDEVMYGDSGYSGTVKRTEVRNDPHLSRIEYRTNVRPSSIKMPDSYRGIQWDKDIENRKSSTRCKVEHPFLIVKRQFGYAKVVYRGLAKNFNRFNVLFAYGQKGKPDDRINAISRGFQSPLTKNGIGSFSKSVIFIGGAVQTLFVQRFLRTSYHPLDLLVFTATASISIPLHKSLTCQSFCPKITSHIRSTSSSAKSAYKGRVSTRNARCCATGVFSVPAVG